MGQMQRAHGQGQDVAPRTSGFTPLLDEGVHRGTLVVVAAGGTPDPHQVWCAVVEDRLYLAVSTGSVPARFLEEDSRVCLLLGDPTQHGSTITGIAVPVLSRDEQEAARARLVDVAPDADLTYRVATGPLVPPELIEDPDERRLLVQSMFSNLPRSVARAMAHQLRYETYAAGQTVVKQGAAADRFFIVVRGEVEVLEEHEDGAQHLSVLGPGESFGEGALLLNTGRTATVRARTPLRVLALNRHTFEQVLLLSTEADADAE